jgi:hypothetical protein
LENLLIVQSPLISAGYPGDPTVKTFEEKTVQHVWADFDAFRRVQAAGTQAASAAKP